MTPEEVELLGKLEKVLADHLDVVAENARLLLQIREWESAVNQFCCCGGGEPGHGCAACDMYHFVKGKTEKPKSAPWTDEQKKALENVADTMTRAIEKRKDAGCPACGLGVTGKDALCDAHYREYLGTHRARGNNEND